MREYGFWFDYDCVLLWENTGQWNLCEPNPNRRNIQFLSSNPGRQRLKDIPSRYRYWLPSRNRVKMCYFVILASLSRGYCRNWGQRPEEVKWAFFTTKKLKRTPLICPPPMFIASLHFFLIKQIFEKNNSSRAASGSRTQF